MFGLNLDKLKHEALIQATKIQLARLEEGLVRKERLFTDYDSTWITLQTILLCHLRIDIEVLRAELTELTAQIQR